MCLCSHENLCRKERQKEVGRSVGSCTPRRDGEREKLFCFLDLLFLVVTTTTTTTIWGKRERDREKRCTNGDKIATQREPRKRERNMRILVVHYRLVHKCSQAKLQQQQQCVAFPKYNPQEGTIKSFFFLLLCFALLCLCCFRMRRDAHGWTESRLVRARIRLRSSSRCRHSSSSSSSSSSSAISSCKLQFWYGTERYKGAYGVRAA